MRHAPLFVVEINAAKGPDMDMDGMQHRFRILWPTKSGASRPNMPNKKVCLASSLHCVPLLAQNLCWSRYVLEPSQKTKSKLQTPGRLVSCGGTLGTLHPGEKIQNERLNKTQTLQWLG